MIMNLSEKLAKRLMCVRAPMCKLTEEEREELHAEQEDRSGEYGIGIKERTNLTPPSGYPEDPEDYADPVNYRYPITDEFVRAALSYFNQEKNREDYTEDEQLIVLSRIIRAALRSDEIETVSYQADDPIYARLPENLKEQLDGFEDTEKRFGGESVEKFVPIHKLDEEHRLVYGVVYSPDEVDAQGDFARAPVIEKMAHVFMAQFQKTDVMHDEVDRSEILVVESYIAPVDFTMGDQEVTKGSWVLVTKILDDDIWEKVKKGELTGYSMGGAAIGQEFEAEAV